jgi:hypothetical protein
MYIRSMQVIFYLSRGSYLRVVLNLRRDFGLGFLRNATTVESLGTLGDGLNAVYIRDGHGSLGTRGEM